jgi:hypothetical protein
VSKYRVTVTRRIAVPARIAYNIIADYRDGHGHISPPNVFSNLVVEEGGFGAGTRICFDVRAFGSTKRHRAHIAEPQPGRVLVETETNDEFVTTFSVIPTADGKSCDVTIDTMATSRDGFLGKIEQTMAKPFLRRLYTAELERLETVAKKRASAERSSGPAAA